MELLIIGSEGILGRFFIGESSLTGESLDGGVCNSIGIFFSGRTPGDPQRKCQ